MIVNQLDLDIAVAEGVISRDQALQLRDLSKRTRTFDDSLVDFSQDARDEPFRLLRGFRDIFIAIGVAVFALGLWIAALTQTFLFGWFDNDFSQVGALSAWSIAIALALCIAGLALAEFITRRQRLPLASLVISAIFAGWSATLFAAIAHQFMAPADASDLQSLETYKLTLSFASLGGAIAGSAFFYWLYRLPFSLFPLAGSLVGVSFLLAYEALGPEWLLQHFRSLIGVWGIIIFLAAMWFDLKDRLRVTRFSECAFWLHLIAAPLLVHTALVPGELAEPSAVAVLGMMALLSVIALLIDRRALLVSGLSYLAVAISQIVSGSTLFGDQTFALTALILGGIVLVLGLGWTPIRRRVMALLPFEAVKSRLPPTAA